MGAAALAACALLTAAPGGCTDTTAEPWKLGAVAPPPLPDASGADADGAPLPQVAALESMACLTPPITGADLVSAARWIASLDQRALVTTATSVDAYRLDAQGCPSTLIDTFGVQGRLPVIASAAAPLPGGRSLIATASGLVQVDGAGLTLSECLLGAAPIAVRMLDMGSDGTGLAAFLRSPIVGLSCTLSATLLCTASSVALADEPFAILALAHTSGQPGATIVQQRAAGSTVDVVSYGATGQPGPSWSSPGSSYPAGLCSAVAAIQTPAAIVVADDTCQRVVVFDPSTLQPRGVAQLDGSPRGITAVGAGEAVLVPIARALQDGAEVTFSVIPIAR
jgi:hypothetical protein